MPAGASIRGFLAVRTQQVSLIFAIFGRKSFFSTITPTFTPTIAPNILHLRPSQHSFFHPRCWQSLHQTIASTITSSHCTIHCVNRRSLHQPFNQYVTNHCINHCVKIFHQPIYAFGHRNSQTPHYCGVVRRFYNVLPWSKGFESPSECGIRALYKRNTTNLTHSI